jgi:hypothetical protein
MGITALSCELCEIFGSVFALNRFLFLMTLLLLLINSLLFCLLLMPLIVN